MNTDLAEIIAPMAATIFAGMIQSGVTTSALAAQGLSMEQINDKYKTASVRVALEIWRLTLRTGPRE